MESGSVGGKPERELEEGELEDDEEERVEEQDEIQPGPTGPSTFPRIPPTLLPPSVYSWLPEELRMTRHPSTSANSDSSVRDFHERLLFLVM